MIIKLLLLNESVGKQTLPSLLTTLSFEFCLLYKHSWLIWLLFNITLFLYEIIMQMVNSDLRCRVEWLTDHRPSVFRAQLCSFLWCVCRLPVILFLPHHPHSLLLTVFNFLRGIANVLLSLWSLFWSYSETCMILCEWKNKTYTHTHTSIKRTYINWQRIVSYLEMMCQSEWHLWRHWLEEVFILSSLKEATVWCVDLLDRVQCWGHIFHSSVTEDKKLIWIVESDERDEAA